LFERPHHFQPFGQGDIERVAPAVDVLRVAMIAITGMAAVRT
jgi:hypothetical protein